MYEYAFLLNWLLFYSKEDADCKNCLISSPNITCTQLRIVGCSDCVAGKTGKPFCNISK